MINFFRKIRKQLADENKPMKYMRYAIGEIILVVIGILIALQINNWNENRNDRRKESILLNQLKQEFKANLAQLNDKIELRNQIVHSSKILLQYFDDPNTAIASDSVVYHLQRTVFVPTFNSNSTDFFSARDIGLLQNDSLRALLADWPGQVDQLVEEELLWLRYREDQYLPFLTSHFQVRNIYNGVQVDLSMMQMVFLDKKETFKDRIGNSREKVDFTELMSSNDFEDHLGYAIMANNISNVQS
ncbi:MAG: DUF6090 family protein [Flavobacteriaceae bacterium]